MTETANKTMVGGTHYLDMGVQPWDVVATWPAEQQVGYFRGGALKYLMRMGRKDEQLQEVRKAMHYVQKLVEVLGVQEGQKTAPSGPYAGVGEKLSLPPGGSVKFADPCAEDPLGLREIEVNGVKYLRDRKDAIWEGRTRFEENCNGK